MGLLTSTLMIARSMTLWILWNSVNISGKSKADADPWRWWSRWLWWRRAKHQNDADADDEDWAKTLSLLIKASNSKGSRGHSSAHHSCLGMFFSSPSKQVFYFPFLSLCSLCFSFVFQFCPSDKAVHTIHVWEGVFLNPAPVIFKTSFLFSSSAC